MTMTVQELLDAFAQCADTDAANQLLGRLKAEFESVEGYRQLDWANDEAGIYSGGQAVVGFEAIRVHSAAYTTTIHPELSDGVLSVRVETNHMRDGLGFNSRDWEPVRQLESELEVTPDDTVQGVAQAALRQAIFQHTTLIERVGIAPAEARAIAEKLWKEGA